MIFQKLGGVADLRASFLEPAKTSEEEEVEEEKKRHAAHRTLETSFCYYYIDLLTLNTRHARREVIRCRPVAMA